MIRLRRLFLLLGLASLGVFLACTGTDPLLGSPADGPDGAAAKVDGAAAADADARTDDASTDAIDDAGELLDNPDFSMGCGDPWENGGTSVLTFEKVKYDGLFACRACAFNDASVYGVDQGVYIPHLPQPAAGVYEATALVRLLPDDAGVPASTSVFIGTFVDKEGEALYGDSTPFQGLTSTAWTRATRQISYDGGVDAIYLELNVLNRRDDKGCFLVTGASFKKVR